MSAPIDLSAERFRRLPVYDGLICVCGCAWWEASVTINSNGCITGFSADSVTCRECAAAPPLQPTGVV